MTRPYEFRPDDRYCLASKDFSGVDFVIDSKSETVWNRRPGDVGLRFLTAISDSEKVDRVAFAEGYHGPLDIFALAYGVPGAFALAFAVHRVHP